MEAHIRAEPKFRLIPKLHPLRKIPTSTKIPSSTKFLVATFSAEDSLLTLPGTNLRPSLNSLAAPLSVTRCIGHRRSTGASKDESTRITGTRCIGQMSSTPDTHGSTTFPVTDSSFNTKEYEVEEMYPSPPIEKEKETEKEKGKGKAKTKGNLLYMLAETLALARCWIDISEDTVVSNNQRKVGFWTCIVQRYNEEGVKPKGAPSHKAPELRKHFERVMFHIGKFHGIYENNCRMMTSDMSYDDVQDLSLGQFASTVSSAGFQHWEAYMKLKNHEIFRAGIEAVVATGSRRTNLIGS